MQLSDEQIDNMKHAIGFQERKIKNGAYEAFRNFFAVGQKSESWEQLVNWGFDCISYQRERI